MVVDLKVVLAGVRYEFPSLGFIILGVTGHGLANAATTSLALAIVA